MWTVEWLVYSQIAIQLFRNFCAFFIENSWIAIWPDISKWKNINIFECEWPNGNLNDLCMAELPFGHSHSKLKRKQKLRDTEYTAITKSPVSSIKCRDVNKNNRLDYQQRIQAIAKSPVSKIRDTDNLAIDCIRSLSHMKISISASSKSHVDLETMSFFRTRTWRQGNCVSYSNQGNGNTAQTQHDTESRGGGRRGGTYHLSLYEVRSLRGTSLLCTLVNRSDNLLSRLQMVYIATKCDVIQNRNRTQRKQTIVTGRRL